MRTSFDYYAILQVHPDADREVIEAAYRKLATRYHPDVSHTADTMEKMKQLNAAYEVLSDPIKRAEYDADRGGASSSETPAVRVVSRLRYFHARRLVIPIGLAALAMVGFRLGPKLVLLLIVFSVFVWLLFALTRPR